MIALALPVVKKVRGSDKKVSGELEKKKWKILEWAGPKLQDLAACSLANIF